MVFPLNVSLLCCCETGGTYKWLLVGERDVMDMGHLWRLRGSVRLMHGPMMQY